LIRKQAMSFACFTSGATPDPITSSTRASTLLGLLRWLVIQRQSVH